MKRIRMPLENVEYTFRFPPKRQITYRWFGEQEGPKGRLVLWNVTGKYYTKMTPQYFTYLCSNRFIKKETVDAIEEKPAPVSQLAKAKEKPVSEPALIKEVAPAPPKEPERDLDKVLPLGKEEIEVLEGWIKRLEALTENEKFLIRAKFPMKKEYKPDNLIVAMRYAIKNGISDNGFGVLVCRYMRIDGAITDFFKKTI